MKYNFEKRERETERKTDRETGRIGSRSLGERKKRGRNDDRRNVIFQVKYDVPSVVSFLQSNEP